MAKRIRVLVVDDSAFSRVIIGRMLEGMKGVEVVGYASQGEEGLRKLVDLKPDLITLDLEMPGMGGLRMLQIVMQSLPTPVIIVSSQFEDRYVLKALELGAMDFVAKPDSSVGSDLYVIEKDLELKVRAAAHEFIPQSDTGGANEGVPDEEISRAAGSTRPGLAEAVVIGASTGGPPALQRLFSSVQKKLPVAFAVAQHMPPGFTSSLAERLNERSALDIREARDGDRMLPGQVLICPGGHNLEFRRERDDVSVRIVLPPLEQIYTPSVDVLFRSAAPVYTRNLLAVVLTGMGNDGAAGVRKVSTYGGRVLSEAEKSCAVYGMPKAAEETGQAEKVVPVSEMWQEIRKRCRQK